MKVEFNKNGYVYLKNVFSKVEIAELEAIIKEASTTVNAEDILDKGNLKFHSVLMHKSEKLRQFISQQKIIDLLAPIAGPDIWVRWDQAVEKKPGAVTFPWHQDNQYSQLKDAHFQFWISLTTMTENNGGLWVVPCSHKESLKYELIDGHVVYQGNTENSEFISAEPGDVVIFSSFLLHSTTPNITQESRWAYVIEYMQMGDIDPYIEPPYLIVAKDAKTHLEYVEHLPGEKSIRNYIKYANFKQKIKSAIGL